MSFKISKGIFLITILLIVSLGSAMAQNAKEEDKQFTDYDNLRMTGDIPRDFTQSTTSKYNRDIKKIAKDEKRNERRTQNRFYEESNFMIDELLLSGKVMFDDTITRYINKVADLILKDDPEFREDIRIYSVKSSTPNAFTTNSGVILVNWGLLNKLENEAQLAAVLSHEFVHFRNEHVIEQYLETTRIKKGVGVYKRSSFLDKLTAKTNYSKELELEADVQSLSTYLNSDYDPQEVVNLFDVLALGHTPFSDFEFDPTYFNTDTLFNLNGDFEVKWNLNEIEENIGSDSSTHPDISERKSSINQELKSSESNGSKKFIVGEKDFMEVQKTVRSELSKLFLYRQNYPMAVYHSLAMLQDDPMNRYLRANIVKAVYSIAKYKNYERYDELMYDYDWEEIQGNSKAVYEFFRTLDQQEATALALSLCYHYQREYDYNNAAINKMLDDLIEDFVVVHGFQVESFVENRQSTEEGSKKNAEFNLGFLVSDIKHQEIAEKALVEFDDLWEKRKLTEQDGDYRKTGDEMRMNGYSLGIDKLVVVDPFYLKVDYRRRNPMNYIDSEASQLDFSDKIKKNADKLDMKVKILNSKTVGKRSAEKFEDLTFLNNWVSERLGYERMDLVSIDYDRLLELKTKYKTPHFLWTGGVNTKEANFSALYNFWYMLIFPPIIPRVVGPKHNTYYYSLLFDLESEEPIVYDYNLGKTKDNRATLNSNIYYHLWQIRKD